MADFEKPLNYRIYLLAMWVERRHDANVPPRWRFSLENPRTGERHGFANLAALVAALEQMMSNDEEQGEKRNDVK